MTGASSTAPNGRIGFRRFEAEGGRLVLNGEPFYMFGALDQDWHPEEECRASERRVSRAALRATPRRWGSTRCAAMSRFRTGSISISPTGSGSSSGSTCPTCNSSRPRRAKRCSGCSGPRSRRTAIIPRSAIWTLFNEGWGIDLDDNPDDRRWLIETFDAAKALIPDSLLVDNSPCFPRNYHLKTDIEDFHWYNGFPHQNEAFAATARAFAARAAWTWSPHGDA